MKRIRLLVMSSLLVLGACAENPEKGTLASLRQVPADTADMPVSEGIDRAAQSYQRFLTETPESALTPEAMRRLADLKLEKEYQLLGGGQKSQMPAPAAAAKIDTRAAQGAKGKAIEPATATASERELERRATNLQS